MKRLRFYILTGLLCLNAVSTSWAMELSVNQPRYVPNEELVLTLIEDWAGEADVYVAVSLPAFDDLYFLTPPQNFVLDFLPYTQNALASGSHELLRMPLLPDLPVGEYTVFAAAMDSLGFFDMLGKTQTSFIYALDAEPVALVLGDIRFPDGVIARRYSLALEPQSGTPPYQFSLSTGSLPAGLTLDKSSGLIQGEPSARGLSAFTVQVLDGQGNTGEIPGAIKVYGVLTFGEHGTFKGCNGLQMAFNAVQDLDEIRIEQGTYDCVGTELAENKAIEHGIKISGGWDAEFKQQTIEPTLTVFDAGNQWIDSADTEELCQDANGEWQTYMKRCFQNTWINGRFFTLNNSGSIAVENFSFKNAYLGSEHGGAILGQGSVTIDQCVFSDNNVASYQDIHGGAVYNVSNISNSTFSNNRAFTLDNSSFFGSSGNVYGGAISNAGNISNSTFNNNSAFTLDDGSAVGGAISNAGNISNSTFSNNSAVNGGAIYDANTITKGTFTNNSVYGSGGAVYDANTITNSTFTNNSADNDGGAVNDVNTITDSTFTNNSADNDGGAAKRVNTITNSSFTNNSAIYGGAVFSTLSTITNSTFTNNSVYSSGGAVFSSSSTITNSTFTNNSASDGRVVYGTSTIINCTIANNKGGGFDGRGTILNTIFAQNQLGEEANDITPDGELKIDYTLANNISGTYDYGTHNITGDPQFVDADNGDFRLLPNSPALNVGDSSVITACSSYTNCDSGCMNLCDDIIPEKCQQSCCSCRQYTYPFLRDDNGNVIDLDGNPRVVGGAIDMGAYERQ
ncbi:Putative Ig [Beggiatoa sp. PS]|nr:Putative Ig [Beggiatoa sp. PS]